MKIGILTYHRSHNYGALLQAIALRYELTKLGHEVYYIDYWPKYHQRMYAYFSFYSLTHRRIRGAFSYIRQFVKYHKQKKVKIERFESFIHDFIVPYCKSINDTYDIIVHGSDQIWRKQEGKWYNPIYFGVHDNIRSKYNVSYAASMGKISKDENDVRLVKRYLTHMDRISVRETDLFDFVKEIGFRDATISMDPTFLLSKSEWDKLIPMQSLYSKKYLLYYKLLDKSFNDKDVYAFAKEHGWDVKVLYGYPTMSKEDENSICTAGPIEFLNLIRNAEFVITSSFHGLAFSLIYQKPFYVAFSIGSSRAMSVLKNVGLEKRLLNPMAKIPSIDAIINYSKIDDKIQRLNKNSILYLRDLKFLCK